MQPQPFRPHLVNFIALQSLTPSLLPAVLDLDQQCLGGLWSADGYQREIDSPNSDVFVLVSETPESSDRSSVLALGCLWAILEEAHITLLAVAPHHQGQGLGQGMLYALLKSAWHRRLERATLEVRVSNQAAIALYQKFGFKEAGRRRGYYQATGEDALILWRGGLHHPEFSQILANWDQSVRHRLAQHHWELRLPEPFPKPQSVSDLSSPLTGP